MGVREAAVTGDVDRARRLRRSMTDAERLLWRHLRGDQLGGLRFRRQEPLGPYVVDFMCRKAWLVIEVDGGQHADSAADAARTEYLEHCGFRVLRFWNNEVQASIEGVIAAIARATLE